MVVIVFAQDGEFMFICQKKNVLLLEFNTGKPYFDERPE